ncbi:MAG: glycosyltransferase family 4 protein [Gemmatimonadetes bacterium]|nr:glycosyltransferase family 4 protein [Gemmatimonadota bacterium]
MKRVVGFSSIPIRNAASGGAERIENLYRHLPDRYQRTVATLGGAKTGRGNESVTPHFTIQAYPSALQTAFYYADRFRIAPFFEVHKLHAKVRSIPRALLREAPDLVQFDSLWLTPWASEVPRGVPVVYASHNYETEWYQGQLRRFPFSKSHLRSLHALERRAVARADLVIAVTDEDRDKMIAELGGRADTIRVIPNGFDDEAIRPADEKTKRRARRALGLPEDRTIALFSGSNVVPNQDAVESIVHVMAPKASEDVLFLVAGSIGEAFRGFQRDNVVFTGRMPALTACFQAADVGLNPIRLGSGSNIKVLQYLGAGLPVISTDFGMRGFEELVPYVAVKRIDLFHRHIGKDLVLATGAVDRVREAYSWRGGAAKLADAYDALLGVNGNC